MGVTAAAGIINYEGYDDLPGCIESLLGQSLPFQEVIVFDNSADEPRRREIGARFPAVRWMSGASNTGYAGGANALIGASRTDFILILNPDVRLRPDHLRTLAAAAETDARVGLLGGKLVREDGSIDSTGIEVRRTRRMFDRRQGAPDSGTYATEEVFAISGAAILLRRAMLQDVAVEGEFFDEDFFVYHEDTDLAWRARLLGWKALFVPAAVAVHKRGWGRDHPRTRVSGPTRFHSFKNHYLEMLKNERPSIFLRDLPFIASWEAARFVWVALREPSLLRAYAAAARLVPRMLSKRKAISARRVASCRELAPFFKGL